MRKQEMRDRIAKIENSLTARQAVIVGIQVALARFKSIAEFWDWYAEHPSEFLGDTGAALSALLQQRLESPWENVAQEFLSGCSKRLRFANLWFDCNDYVEQTLAKNVPKLDQVIEGNSQEMTQLRYRRAALAATEILNGETHKDDNVADARADKLKPRDPRVEEIQRLLHSVDVAAQGVSDTDVCGLLEDLFAARFAVTAVSNRYFEGRSILFADGNQGLEELIEIAQAAADLRNRLRASRGDLNETDSATSKPSPLRANLDEIRLAARKRSQVIVHGLLTGAESRTGASSRELYKNFGSTIDQS